MSPRSCRNERSLLLWENEGSAAGTGCTFLRALYSCSLVKLFFSKDFFSFLDWSFTLFKTCGKTCVNKESQHFCTNHRPTETSFKTLVWRIPGGRIVFCSGPASWCAGHALSCSFMGFILMVLSRMYRYQSESFTETERRAASNGDWKHRNGTKIGLVITGHFTWRTNSWLLRLKLEKTKNDLFQSTVSLPMHRPHRSRNECCHGLFCPQNKTMTVLFFFATRRSKRLPPPPCVCVATQQHEWTLRTFRAPRSGPGRAARSNRVSREMAIDRIAPRTKRPQADHSITALINIFNLGPALGSLRTEREEARTLCETETLRRGHQNKETGHKLDRDTTETNPAPLWQVFSFSNQ